MTLILALIFFVFGLIMGSFFNVVILRLNTERSFGGRSGCMSCQNKLTWYELIPVFSFIFLRGRCRNCKTKISIQYIIVELMVGFIFTILFFKFQDLFYLNILTFSFTYAYYATMFSLLLIISVYDFKHKIIPDILSFTFGFLAFIGLFLFDVTLGQFSFGFFPHIPTLFEFLSGFFMALPFALFWLVSRGAWMGLGDAKLALGLGWLLGPFLVFSGMIIAFWVGAVVGLLLIIFSKKYGLKSEIPFAPYLALGTLFSFIFELHLF